MQPIVRFSNVLVVLVLLSGCSKNAPPETIKDESPVSITVKAAKSGTNNAIVCEIKNNTADAICLYGHDVPWILDGSILLHLEVDGVYHERIERKLPLEGLPSRELIIKPHSSESGVLELDWQFPSLRSALQTNGVILFWSYKPTYNKTEQCNRVGGFAYFAALNPAQSDPNSSK